MRAAVMNMTSEDLVLPSFYDVLAPGETCFIYRSWAEFNLSLTSLKGQRFLAMVDEGKITCTFSYEKHDEFVPLPGRFAVNGLDTRAETELVMDAYLALSAEEQQAVLRFTKSLRQQAVVNFSDSGLTSGIFAYPVPATWPFKRGDVVAIMDNKAVLACPQDPERMPACGVVLEIKAGEVMVQSFGPYSCSGYSFSPGRPVFVSSDGRPTQMPATVTAPCQLQMIGMALTPDTVSLAITGLTTKKA